MLHLSGRRVQRGGEAAGAQLLLQRQYGGLHPYILYHRVCQAKEQTYRRLGPDGLFYAMVKMQQLQSRFPKSIVAGIILCICFVCKRLTSCHPLARCTSRPLVTPPPLVVPLPLVAPEFLADWATVFGGGTAHVLWRRQRRQG